MMPNQLEATRDKLIAQARAKLEAAQGKNDYTPEYVRTDAYATYRDELDAAYEEFEAAVIAWLGDDA